MVAVDMAQTHLSRTGSRERWLIMDTGRAKPTLCSWLLSCGIAARFFAAFFCAFLLDLARKLAAGAEQLARQICADAQNLAAQNAELLLAARPLADRPHLLGSERLAIHHAALGREWRKVLVVGDRDNFFGERNDVFA